MERRPHVLGGEGAHRRIALAVALGAIALIAASLSACRNEKDSGRTVDDSNRPAVIRVDGFAGSEACRECHEREYSTWHSSYHRTMTQVASPATVIGDFSGVEVSQAGAKCGLSRDGDRFIADLTRPGADNAAPVKRDIALCTGSHHMQVYWYPTGESRVLAQLPFVWLQDLGRWVPRNAAFLRPPQREPTDERGRWNETCIKCHTTGARPGIVDDAHMDSHAAQFGIACEACHGPAAEHVKAKGQGEAGVVNPAKLSHEKSAELCGQCHSVSEFATNAARENWQKDGYNYRPGGDLAAERAIVRARREDLRGRNIEFLHVVASAFWSDGMVRVAGREYNGLLESPCFQRGEMTCISCHSLHQSEDDSRPAAEWADDQLRAGMRTNAACTQCHEKFATAEAVAAHTHHAADSSGSQCMNCHMPYTSYGLLKATRSHQVTSPSIAATVATGRPNACNQCHLDKTLDWTAKQLFAWYGTKRPPLPGDQRDYAAVVVAALSGDAGQRALAAWNLGWAEAQETSGSDWLVPLLARLMDDPYDAVRLMASRSLRSIEGYRDFEFDPLAGPSERQKAIARLLDLWQQRTSQLPGARFGKAILLDANGGLRREEFDRLLRARDQRDVTLVE